MRVLVNEPQGCLGEAQNDAQGILARRSEICFAVYGEPVPMQRPRVESGHAYTPKKTADWEDTIALVYKSLYHGFIFEKGIPLRIEMDFYFQIAQRTSKKKRADMIAGEMRPTKRPDVDNVVKLVLDAGNGVIWRDDSQIVEMVARKHWADKGRTEIYVSEV